jgi:biotin carboxylase
LKRRKRLLILAGTHFQIPVIEYAKESGHYVITCDNRPDNPGHRLADEYINVSTTDLNGILEVAFKKEIDGILAYASDPAALTAAYVSEKLKIPGNSYNSVHTLSDKGQFRKFLTNNNFPVPKFRVIRSIEEAKKVSGIFQNNIFVKPVDSSGSKGITKLPPGENLKSAYNYALKFSRKGEVIIEEEINRSGPHIHGEAFVHNGELKFMLLGDQYFSAVNSCAPLTTTLPSLIHKDVMDYIDKTLRRIIKLVNFQTGGLNIEIIRDSEDRIYFIEIGARSGGNLMPELACMATGFNLAAANVNAALQEEIDFHFDYPAHRYYTQVILHSHKNGKYNGANIPEEFKDNLKTELIYYTKDDNVNIYRNSQDVIGLLLFAFNDKDVCNRLIRFVNHNNVINLL